MAFASFCFSYSHILSLMELSVYTHNNWKTQRKIESEHERIQSVAPDFQTGKGAAVNLPVVNKRPL
ncbi:MAG: hypothetical protein CVU74_08230 [Deltaproteobacteria bacterium HGW-Deltaproteobacteria-9]|nr:MAG: hypothetical protein CVU74_08230 [Deltaproteobacteria bacterium HGW-Deltaproteobacteria-9]